MRRCLGVPLLYVCMFVCTSQQERVGERERQGKETVGWHRHCRSDDGSALFMSCLSSRLSCPHHETTRPEKQPNRPLGVENCRTTKHPIPFNQWTTIHADMQTNRQITVDPLCDLADVDDICRLSRLLVPACQLAISLHLADGMPTCLMTSVSSRDTGLGFLAFA